VSDLELKRVAERRAVSVARARGVLTDLRDVGVVVGWNEVSGSPPTFIVQVAGEDTSRSLTAKEVGLFKAGVDAGIDAMRKRGLV
jgi:hypothetical protein